MSKINIAQKKLSPMESTHFTISYSKPSIKIENTENIKNMELSKEVLIKKIYPSLCRKDSTTFPLQVFEKKICN
tara:strand:+ start:6562 stop:6783 length:222 start_codon:yes stop_codon:yes gene_type:complete